MGTYSVLIFLILFRLFDFFVSYISPHFIPYLGFFPYKEIFKHYPLPSYIFSFANFDGLHYIRTALYGYSQYAQAFFPLYPLLIRHLSFIFGNNPIITGLAISFVSYCIGILFFYGYLKQTIRNEQKIYWSLVFICLYPASFFFGAAYNTSLFFCLAVGSLYFFEKKYYIAATILSMLATTTRIEGIFLCIPFIMPLLFKKTHQKNLKEYIVLAAPIAGLAMFMSYLWATTGDPLFFLNSQPAFGANRSSKLIFLPQVLYRYIKIFITANHDFRYWISLSEFSSFILITGVMLGKVLQIFKEKKLQTHISEIGLLLFSFSVIILPTLTGTLSSIPRYSLFSFSFFIILAQIKNIFLKILIAMIFLILHTIMLGFFIQGYFVS